ncbi:MAG: hypothetical protein ACI9V1_002974 [Spirosomataceae bacterium]
MVEFFHSLGDSIQNALILGRTHLFLFTLYLHVVKLITLEIKGARLEEKNRAKAIGKSVQELVNEIIPKKLPFDVPKLNVQDYATVYDPQLSEKELEADDDSSIQPFSHVTDTVKYARKLRKDAWQMK